MTEQDRLARFAELFEYPTAATLESAGSLGIDEFAVFAQREGLVRAQEVYTATFDLNPTCSPYVAYQLFGESFKRGALMAKLRETYAEHGFAASRAELPDHLGIMLRFVAECRNEELAREIVAELLLPAIGKMAASFADTANPYGFVLHALLAGLERQTAVVPAGGSLDG